MKFLDFSPLPEIENLRRRDVMIGAIRDWFHRNGFFEVETPVRIRHPAPEAHIDCPPSRGAWLRASPELQMKSLLAVGAEKIFQIGPCFRESERGKKHNPEFTMLEWYRSGENVERMLEDTKELIRAAALAARGAAILSFRGTSIDLDADWERITVREAFLRYAKWDPTKNYDADRFDLDLTTLVEPSLPADRPCVLCEYPKEAASLARLKDGDPSVAERWELYIGGLELANAYAELTDGKEQRRRFEIARQLRSELNEAEYGLDEDFLRLLEADKFPDCGGIALGIDRLAMLICDAESIDAVRAFCPKIGECW